MYQITQTLILFLLTVPQGMHTKSHVIFSPLMHDIFAAPLLKFAGYPNHPISINCDLILEG